MTTDTQTRSVPPNPKQVGKAEPPVLEGFIYKISRHACSCGKYTRCLPTDTRETGSNSVWYFSNNFEVLSDRLHSVIIYQDTTQQDFYKKTRKMLQRCWAYRSGSEWLSEGRGAEWGFYTRSWGSRYSAWRLRPCASVVRTRTPGLASLQHLEFNPLQTQLTNDRSY